MITPLQAHLARTMTGLSQQDIAGLLGWAHQTLSKIEKGDVNPPASRLKVLQEFYESRGVEFLEGDGVRRRLNVIRRLQGHEGFSAFLDDVFQTALQYGTPQTPLEIFLSNVRHQNWITWMGPEKWAAHAARMEANKHIMDVRIIVQEGDWHFPAQAYSDYRWFPKSLFSEESFYSYHDRLAFLDFKSDQAEVTIMHHREFAEGYRNLFRAVWDKATIKPTQESKK